MQARQTLSSIPATNSSVPHRRPALEEYLAGIHAIPVGHFLLADLGRVLRVVLQHLEAVACDPQRHALGIADRLRIGIQPDLIRLLRDSEDT